MAAMSPAISGDNMVLSPDLESKNVYELYGEEGSGKTQCLLHLAAICLLPEQWNGIILGGKSTGVIYMDNDYHFNVLRLTVIMEQRIIAAAGDVVFSDEQLDLFIKQCLKNLYLVRCTNSAQIVITLYSLEPILRKKSNVSVLMIDSIASFYWIDRSNGTENIAAQESNLVRVCSAIDDIKDKYDLTVYATKPALFSRKTKDESDDRADRILDHCEYLCKMWQRLVTHRIIFSKNSGYQSFHVKSDKGDLKIDVNFTVGDSGYRFVK